MWFGERAIRKGIGSNGREHNALRNWQINQPLFDGSGRWREEMTPEQKATFKKVAGRLLVRLGYAADRNW